MVRSPTDRRRSLTRRAGIGASAARRVDAISVQQWFLVSHLQRHTTTFCVLATPARLERLARIFKKSRAPGRGCPIIKGGASGTGDHPARNQMTRLESRTREPSVRIGSGDRRRVKIAET